MSSALFQCAHERTIESWMYEVGFLAWMKQAVWTDSDGSADLSLQDLLGDDLAVLVELVQDGDARSELEADCAMQANGKQK